MNGCLSSVGYERRESSYDTKSQSKAAQLTITVLGSGAALALGNRITSHGLGTEWKCRQAQLRWNEENQTVASNNNRDTVVGIRVMPKPKRKEPEAWPPVDRQSSLGIQFQAYRLSHPYYLHSTVPYGRNIICGLHSPSSSGDT